jgi:hypothetical protein
MPYITIEEEVWVDLDDFETEDLIEELKRRKSSIPSTQSGNAIDIINDIYTAKHIRNQDYSKLVDELIYSVLGKII